MALPNSNITTSLVGTTLGLSTRNVGTLCTSTAINKWSKWKPVRFNKVTGITAANLEAVNYGIGLRTYSNLDSLIADYQALTYVEMWPYNRPRGGNQNEFYRLGDFRNYEHNAYPPVGGYYISNQATNIAGGQTTIMGSLMVNSDPSQYEIGFNDVVTGSRKLAIAITHPTNYEVYKTAVADEIGDISVEIDTRSPLPVLSIGQYRGFLFLTNNAGTVGTGIAGLPNFPARGFLINVVGNQVLVSMRCTWTVDGNGILVVVEANNQTGAPVNMLNCVIQARSSANSCSSSIVQGEKFQGLGTIVAPIGKNEILRYVFNITRSDFPSWKVCWTNTGAYPNSLETNILTPM